MGWLDAYETHTVGAGRLDPSSPEAAAMRLKELAAHLPVAVDDAVWIDSASNNVWRIGQLFLRICFRGDRGRLEREALLLDALPGEIPHPDVAAVGRRGGLSWMLTHATVGEPLIGAARGDTSSRLRPLVAQFAHALRCLHSWSPPPVLADALEHKHLTINNAEPLGIVGWDTVAVPAVRARRLIEPIKTLPFVDHGLIDAAAARLAELAVYDDPAGYTHVLHGDAGLTNVLFHQGAVTAVIDFEFARLGPIDLELLPLVRALDGESLMGHPLPPVVTWIADEYPELFSHPNLRERMWLYAVAFAVQTILFWPPDQPEEADLHPVHPLRLLRRLVDQPLPFPS